MISVCLDLLLLLISGSFNLVLPDFDCLFQTTLDILSAVVRDKITVGFCDDKGWDAVDAELLLERGDSGLFVARNS